MKKNKNYFALTGAFGFFAVTATLMASGAGGVARAATAFATLDSFSGPPGRVVNVSGGNFLPGEVVNIFLGSTLNQPSASTTARGDSLFGPVAVTIPASTIQGSLLITAMGASSNASAANSYFVDALTPSIKVTTSSSATTPGNVLRIDGSGFVPNEVVAVTLGKSYASTTADSNGSFGSLALTIPFIPSGTYLIQATGQSSHASAQSFFFVAGFFPNVTPSSFFLIPGTTLSFSGTGFAPNEGIDIFTSTSTASSSAHFSADGAGGFTDQGAMQVPFSSAGTTMNFVILGSQSNASVTLALGVGQLNAVVTLSKYFLMPGDQLSLSGHGYANNETIDVFAGSFTPSSTPLTTFAADGAGTFTNAGSFAVPFDLMGSSTTLSVVGRTSGVIAQAGVTVGTFTPAITPTAFFLQRGDQFMIKGTGFAPNESVQVTAPGNAAQSAFADASGTAGIGPFTVPLSATSTLDISAIGSLSHATATTAISIGNAVPQQVVTSTLTVYLAINNNAAQASSTASTTAGAGDFTVAITGANASPASFPGDASGTTVILQGDTGFSVSASSSFPNYAASTTSGCAGPILGGASGTCTITETYVVPPFSFSFDPSTLPDGTVNASYTVSISASTTGMGVFTWNVASGTLPAGLALDTSSTVTATTLSGSPTATGTYMFTIGAMLGSSTFAHDYTLNINDPATVLSSPPVVVVVSQGVPVGSGGGGGGGYYNPYIPPLPSSSTGQVLGTSTISIAGRLQMLASLTAQLIALQKRFVTIQFQSKACAAATFSRNLDEGMNLGEVRDLQRALNTNEFTRVAATGAGSPGDESTYFGPATKKAVIAFQDIFADEILKPAGLKTGNGYVGPLTRAMLASLCNGTAPSGGTASTTLTIK